MINIWRKVRIATMLGSDYGLLEHAALVVRGDRIDWLGPDQQLPQEQLDQAVAIHDCDGRLLTPGLIDCHTHLVYGGNRAGEFEQRLQGMSYADIARQGGGIVATVKATRAASDEELLAGALQRVDALQAEGVTTVEIKSGYGLNTETELKMLRVARRLERERALTVKTTFLGAHAIPPEFQGRADDYIELICTEMLPAVAEQRLADSVDAFLETIAFDPPQVERVFSKARQLGLAVKLHADQLNNTYGAVLAARFGALSADHLEYTDETGISAMQIAGTVAVLLPGAFYTLGETQLPPVDLLREYEVPIALATDLNPGSSPLYSILLVMNMACTLFRLTPEEALAGVTRNAAKALGLGDEIGTLEVGKAADLVLWDVTEPAELTYRIGYNPCRQVVKGGKTVLQR